jgi:hypothetical protein
LLYHSLDIIIIRARCNNSLEKEKEEKEKQEERNNKTFKETKNTVRRERKKSDSPNNLT